MKSKQLIMDDEKWVICDSNVKIGKKKSENMY